MHQGDRCIGALLHQSSADSLIRRCRCLKVGHGGGDECGGGCVTCKYLYYTRNLRETARRADGLVTVITSTPATTHPDPRNPPGHRPSCRAAQQLTLSPPIRDNAVLRGSSEWLYDAGAHYGPTMKSASIYWGTVTWMITTILWSTRASETQCLSTWQVQYPRCQGCHIRS